VLSLLTGADCISSQQLIGSGSVWELDSGEAYRYPFRTVSALAFILRKISRVKLALHNIISRLVKVIENGIMSAGEYHITIDCRELSSGIYLLKVGSTERLVIKKLILIK